jgi:hypothetical protein
VLKDSAITALCVVVFALAGAARADAPYTKGIDHWAFKAPVRPAVPAHASGDAIDAFVSARLEKDGLKPSPEVDRRTLIRRVTFDLIGLPPTPEEIDAFVKDQSSNAYEKLVDRLLASPRYGERWARHWLDVVRFAESNGFEMNWQRPSAYHYRDWVIKALNDDMPYDRFVRAQLAGDATAADDAATGFLVGGAWDQVKSPDPVLTANQRADELHDMVSTTGSALLGLTVGCARCHDHKFDPISQTDYYKMTAVFTGVQHGERPLANAETRKRAEQIASLKKSLRDVDTKLAAYEPLAHPEADAGTDAKTRPRPGVRVAKNVDHFAPVRARFIRFTILETTDAQPCIDELEIYSTGDRLRNVALASNGGKATASSTLPGFAIHQLSHLNDGRIGNEWSWISNEIGKGWVQIQLPQVMEIDRVVWGRDREMKYKDRLASRYVIEVAEEPGKWTVVAREVDRRNLSLDGTSEELYAVPDPAASHSADELAALLMQRKTIRDELARPGAGEMMAYGGRFRETARTFRLARGDPSQPKEEVTPGGIASIGVTFDLAVDAPEQLRRVKLAEWITDPSNPLTARVIVNRIWQHHFGAGLVATPSDFGNMGARPTHPELLDWLATELVAQQWKLKPIHRLMCLSATYRQSSDARPDAMTRDATTSLLWRYPPRRLEAEAIRDAMLAVSGKLDLTMGGPGFEVFKPNDNYVRVYDPKDVWAKSEWRRMIYALKIRSQQDATFGAFDCPDGAQITPKRPTSTTPLQALNLLNGSFVLQQSDFLAERLQSEVGLERAREVDRAFELCFGRRPTETEESAAMKLIAAQGVPAFCRAMFNANEFVYVR